jgi:acetamidase/formamidase
MEAETILANKIIAAIPSIERVRLCNTGTEAVIYARRLARTFTGRQKVIRFEGMYHGFSDGVYWSKRVTLPYRPHIGTLSCSPEIDSINTLTPDAHGGNMDLPDMGPGSITYLPVRTAGARLFIGDAHACQGDGEVCGTAVEYPSTTTIQVDVIKGWNLEWPRLENESRIMCIGSARPLEDAARIAYKDLVLWMEAEYGYDRCDAYMMLSQCGIVRLGNFVDPKYTVGAGIEKKYLAPAAA